MRSEPALQAAELCDHIVEWGTRIPAYIGGRSFAEFSSDEMAYLAVWKCVEVIGEASGRILKLDVSPEAFFPDRSLRDAYEMRNRLTHGYSTVDLQVLWGAATVFVPEIVETARQAARQLRSP